MTFAQRVIFYVGIAAVVLIPTAHLDGINRFVQLPQALVMHGVAICGLVAWLIWGQWRYSALVFPVLVFLFFEVFSVFQAHSPIFSLLPISIHLAGFALFLVLINGLTRSLYVVVVQVVCVCAGVLSVLGLMQFWGVGETWVPTAGLPSATFGHRNLAAAYLIGLIPLTFWLWWSARDRWNGVGWAVILGLEVSFLLATRSRGAWVSLVVGCVFVCVAGFWLYRRLSFRLTRIQICGLGVAIILVIGTAWVPAQVQKGAGEAMWHGKVHLSDAVTSVVKTGGDKSRLTLWKHTMSMIAAYPFGGVGAGNWRLMYPVFANGDLMHPQTVPYRPHNDFLWIWSETGIGGAFAFVAVMWVAMFLAWTAPEQAEGIKWAFMCSLIAVVVNGAFGFSRAFAGAWMPFWLVLVGVCVLHSGEPTKPKGLRWGILLGLLVLVASGQSLIRQIDFDRAFLNVRVAFAQEQWPLVIAAANRALYFGQFDEEALMMRGRAYAEQGYATQALKDYRAGLDVHPHSVALWNGAGNALRMQGQYGDAREAYLKALTFDPASGEAFNNLGTLYAASGLIDSALVVYEKALPLAVDVCPIYANMSIVYRKKGQLALAIESAQKALAIDPEHLEALVACGNAFLAAHRYADAAHTFSKARQLSPSLASLHFSLAQAYEGMGDVDGAVVSYQSFLNVWTGGDVPQVRFVKKRLKELSSPK